MSSEVLGDAVPSSDRRVLEDLLNVIEDESIMQRRIVADHRKRESQWEQPVAGLESRLGYGRTAVYDSCDFSPRRHGTNHYLEYFCPTYVKPTIPDDEGKRLDCVAEYSHDR